LSLYIHILCKPIFLFNLHPFTFTRVQIPKITFILFAFLRFSSKRYHRIFHFIPPNLNRKNNMDKTFYPYIIFGSIKFFFTKRTFNLFPPLDIKFHNSSFLIKHTVTTLFNSKIVLMVLRTVIFILFFILIWMLSSVF
jgi:hypothetical protein